MRYLCVHCDQRFDHEGDKRPRCPKCMRVNGIEKITATGEAGKRPWVLPAGVALAVALAVIGYLVWSRGTPDTVGDDVALRPLERSELLGHVRRLRADVPDSVVGLLDADEAVEALGETLRGGDATVERFRARASKRAFVPWGMGSPRETPLRSAAETATRLAEDGAQERLYPLEVAALAVAALRAAGETAMVAEIWSFPGDRSPPDPSGHFGYFGVALYAQDADDLAAAEPRVLDPYAGRGSAPPEDGFRVLTDVQVLGAAMGHLAIHKLVRDGDHARAFDLSSAALALDPRSPSLHSVHGAVLLVSGGAQEGIREFEAAAQLRSDAPRHNNLAALALADQPPDLERAAREVAAALEQHEDYAAGHATMAAIHMARDEVDLARRELQTAERLDAELPILPMLWANLHLAAHDVEQAASAALEAVERQPHNWQVRLNAARVLRVAGRYDEMRRQARQIVEMVPEGQRAAVEQLCLQVLGPTALEEPLEDEGAPGDDGDAEPGAAFQLGAGSLLGEGEGGRLGGSLLGEELGGEGDLPNAGDPSTLRLGGQGGGLRLDLGE